MDEDVVLITFEYRLGLFGKNINSVWHTHTKRMYCTEKMHMMKILQLFGQGFLNTGDREATGNMGFKVRYN